MQKVQLKVMLEVLAIKLKIDEIPNDFSHSLGIIPEAKHLPEYFRPTKNNMNMTQPNTELFNLYTSHQAAFHAVIDMTKDVGTKTKINGPYLCAPSNNYWNSKFKVVFVGQETNGWGEDFVDIQSKMKKYSDFNVGETYYASPFWNVIRKLEKAFTGSELNCAVLNLNKFDVNRKRPKPPFVDPISKLDQILLEELEILKPHLVIFFTGPLHGYDERICKLFGTELVAIEGYKRRHLAELKIPGKPFKVIRTYHPNYLRRSGSEDSMIKFIVDRYKAIS